MAVATTSNFILGSTANTADAPTAVQATNVDGHGGLNAPLFTFTNNSTGSSATPLSLIAPSGRPPFTVNTQTKVTNLNADLLDGIDSSGFVHASTMKTIGPVTVAGCTIHPCLDTPLIQFGQLTFMKLCRAPVAPGTET